VIALFLRREASTGKRSRWCGSWKASIRATFSSAGRSQPAQGRRRGHGRRAAYQELLAKSSRHGYFADARLELAYFDWRRIARQRHYDERRRLRRGRPEQDVGLELKVRSLLAAGECYDLNGERKLRCGTISDHRGSPEHLSRRTARKHCAVPTGLLTAFS